MNLYFSDWTNPQTLTMLEEKGIPADRLIKVFASRTDPSQTLGRQILTVEEDGSPFTRNYHFEGRGTWLQEEMEEYLSYYHLPNEANEKVRALFRFADRPELEISHLAMLVINAHTREPHYKHPLRIIDGLDEARDRGRYSGLHLDVFTSRSIERLSKIVNLEKPESLVSLRESVMLSRIETQAPTKEARF